MKSFLNFAIMSSLMQDRTEDEFAKKKRLVNAQKFVIFTAQHNESWRFRPKLTL